MSEETLRRAVERAMATGRTFHVGTMQSARVRPELVLSAYYPPAVVERVVRAVASARPGTGRWACTHEPTLGRMRVSPEGRPGTPQ